jgi:hypothetical protein
MDRREGSGGEGIRVGAWRRKRRLRTEDGGFRRRRVRERSFKDGDSAEEVGDGGFEGGDTSVGEKEARRMHGRRQTLF